jgi:hypothetical protein
MTCIDCIYYTDERGKHLNGCFLFPYKHTDPDDYACIKFILSGGKQMSEGEMAFCRCSMCGHGMIVSEKDMCPICGKCQWIKVSKRKGRKDDTSS